MKKNFIYALLGLSLAIGSCGKTDDLRPDTEINAQEYVTLKLAMAGEEGESEQARALFYHDGTSIKFTFHDPKSTATTRKVETKIYNGDNLIYNQVLDWKVERNGTRLTYSGDIRIKANLLTNPNLRLEATTNPNLGQPYIYYRDQNAPSHLREFAVVIKSSGGASSAQSINTSFKMNVKVQQQGSKLVIADHPEAKFRPQGHLMRLSIQNNMKVPTFATGISVQYQGENRSQIYEFYTKDVYSENINGILPVKQGGQRNKEQVLLWLPNAEIGKNFTIRTLGPAAGTAVPTKISSKAGGIYEFLVTVNPGEILEPLGIYTSSERVVQYWIDIDKQKAFYYSHEKEEALAQMRNIDHNAYIPAYEQLAYFGTTSLDSTQFNNGGTKVNLVDNQIQTTYVYHFMRPYPNPRPGRFAAPYKTEFYHYDVLNVSKEYTNYEDTYDPRVRVKYMGPSIWRTIGTSKKVGEVIYSRLFENGDYRYFPMYNFQFEDYKYPYEHTGLTDRYTTLRRSRVLDDMQNPSKTSSYFSEFAFLPNNRDNTSLDPSYWEDKTPVIYKFPLVMRSSSYPNRNYYKVENGRGAIFNTINWELATFGGEADYPRGGIWAYLNGTNLSPQAFGHTPEGNNSDQISNTGGALVMFYTKSM